MQIDRTRTAAAKARTSSRRNARRLAAALDAAALVALVAFGDTAPVAPALVR